MCRSRGTRMLALVVAALGVCAPVAAGSTYVNPSALGLAAGAGATEDNKPASIYPSVIDVEGVPGRLVETRATVRGITHVFPDQIDALLVAPDGSKSILFSDVCSSAAVNLLDLTLDDAASTSVPTASPCSSGSYRPFDNEPGTGPGQDPFPPPAPSGPYTAAMSNFAGGEPNGAWRLYVMDDDFTEGGAIGGGWTLEFLTDARCAGRTAALASHVGTAGADTISGTAGPDVLLGLGGRDRITGLGGKDVICGGSGKDTISGGSGKDRLLGEGGKDKLKGNAGKDTCKGGKGSDDGKSCEKERSL